LPSQPKITQLKLTPLVGKITHRFFPLLLQLASFWLLVCLVPPLWAELAFQDTFENLEQAQKNWQGKDVQWQLSSRYNKSPNGQKSLRLSPTKLGAWQEIRHPIEVERPVHLRIWFYERGWENRIKVDQQYLFIGDKDTFANSERRCQIGQSGHKDYQGFYVVFVNGISQKSKTRANQKRWVKFEFVVESEGNAEIRIDDQNEVKLPDQWEGIGIVGLGVFGREDRGGNTDAYWDHLEIFKGEEAPALAVEPLSKFQSESKQPRVRLNSGNCATNWGALKRFR